MMPDKGSDKISKFETSSAVELSTTGSQSLIYRLKDSIKPNELAAVSEDIEYNDLPEQEKIQMKLASQPYQKVLDQRHLIMIAIGGTLGTGLFIGLAIL